MNIKILGTGCAKCEKLYNLTNQAIADLEIEADVEKVKDLNKIMEYNVMMTPALVFNNQVKSSGKLPSLEQIKSWISEN